MNTNRYQNKSTFGHKDYASNIVKTDKGLFTNTCVPLISPVLKLKNISIVIYPCQCYPYPPPMIYPCHFNRDLTMSMQKNTFL